MSEIDKATPGPWRTTKAQPNVIVNDGGDKWIARALIGKGSPRFIQDDEIAAANAALIVSAVNAYRRASGEASETPAAHWRLKGSPDFHGTRYDCERAKLVGGDMTDDELANAVFVDPTMANLTAAKDRIRWLSRALVAATAHQPQTRAED